MKLLKRERTPFTQLFSLEEEIEYCSRNNVHGSLMRAQFVLRTHWNQDLDYEGVRSHPAGKTKFKILEFYLCESCVRQAV